MRTPFIHTKVAQAILICGICFFGLLNVHAQDSDHASLKYMFEGVSSEQSLPHYATHHIMQDSFGFIWISTRDGLCRFDGTSCTVFRADNEKGLKLEGNVIWLTFEDSKRRLWIGTKGGGLSYYNPKTKTSKVFRQDDGNPNSLNNDIVTAIFEDGSNNIWVGTDGGGLNKVVESARMDSIHFEHIPLIESQESNLAVLDIEESVHGKLWIATYGYGVLLYDPYTKQVETLNSISPEIQINDDYVMTLASEGSTMWVGTKFGGLSRINVENKTVRHFQHDTSNSTSLPHNFVWDIFIDESGNKWVGTYGGGLARLEKGSSEFQLVSDANAQNGFSSGFVLHTMQDNQGQLWVATDSQGAFRFNVQSAYKPVNIEWGDEKNTSNLIINNLFLDSKNQFWISTNSGLFTATEDFKNVEKKQTGFGTSIFYEVNEDETGRIWIASNSDLGYYNPKTGLWGDLDIAHTLNVPGTDRYFDIEFGEDGLLWLATDGGLLSYHPDTKKIELFRHKPGEPQTITGNKIGCILMDNNSIWVGTDDLGISVFNTVTKKAKKIDFSTYLPNHKVSDYITDISKDSLDNIVVGTADKGVYYIHRTKGEIDSVTHINKENSLQSSAVFDIQPLGNFLLITYREGVSKINTATFQPVNTKLPRSISAAGAKELFETDGKLYLFNRDKIFEVFPKYINDEARPPSVQLTGLEMYDKPIAPQIGLHVQDGLDLDYDEDFITITYSTLNYDINDSFFTEYILEGHDPYWLAGGESETINYASLQPGKYVFKVRFSGDINQRNQLEIPITVHAAFWQTTLFKIIMLLLIVIFLYMAFRYRTFYLLKEERTRTRIARDLHDDLSGTLSSISFFSEAAQRVQSKPEELKRFLQKIDISAAEAKEKINDIIWAIDPSKDNWSVFLKKCKRHATDTLDSKEIEYDINIDDTFKVKIELELRQNLWLIYKEMINNLAEHSRATKAEILFTENDRIIHLKVSDNGRGFNEEKKHSGNGIENIIQRTKLIGGEIDLKTSPDQGTEWNLKLKP